MNIQFDEPQQQMPQDPNTVPKFTKLFQKALDQFRMRTFFLLLERIYLLISMSIILFLLAGDSCGWNDMHYWILFSDIQAIFSLALYAQIFHLSNKDSITQHLAFHYVQIVFVPVNEATDHPVAPEVLDPTAMLSEVEITKKVDVMALQIRQEIVNQNKICRINNYFSNFTNQLIFVWTMYYLVVNPYDDQGRDNLQCDKWPIIQTYIYGTLLFIQYSQYYLLAALGLVLLPLILCYLLIKCFSDRKKKKEAQEALVALQRNKIEYKPNALQGEQECSICMQPYVTGDEVLVLPCSVFHHYHNNCISAWLQVQSTCPNCRQQLLPENLQAPLLQVQQPIEEPL